MSYGVEFNMLMFPGINYFFITTIEVSKFACYFYIIDMYEVDVS